jgi:hypothetical protein
MIVADGCQKRRRMVKRDKANMASVIQSRHTSRKRFAEEVAAREDTRAQTCRITFINRAFVVETKQLSSKQRTQSPSVKQQQPVLRANATSHRVRYIGCKGEPVATRKTRMHVIHCGLKPIQERGEHYKASD